MKVIVRLRVQLVPLELREPLGVRVELLLRAPSLGRRRRRGLGLLPRPFRRRGLLPRAIAVDLPQPVGIRTVVQVHRDLSRLVALQRRLGVGISIEPVPLAAVRQEGDVVAIEAVLLQLRRGGVDVHAVRDPGEGVLLAGLAADVGGG